MPTTSSAVPADLLALERTAEAGAARLRGAATVVLAASTQLSDSRSTGLGRLDLATLARRLRRHIDDVAVVADGVGDVGHAFALAGGGAHGPIAAADRFLAACRRLPGGRAATLAELARMSYLDRLRWFRRFLATGIVPDDPNFRAVEGVLAAAHGAGRGGLWDDDAFRLADAGLLESMQLGLLVAAAGGAGRPARDDPRSRAVAAWVDYARSGGDERDRDSAWAFGEEQSVRYGESLADAADLRFGPALEDFVRFSHVYRAAIHRQEEVALAAAIVASLDPEALARLADDVADALLADVVGFPIEPLDDLVRDVVERLDPFGLFDRLPFVPGVPLVKDVVDQFVRAFAPESIAAMMLDPSATPPNLVQSVLDDVLDVPPPMADPPAAYYVGMLADRGYLAGLPTSLPDIPGAVPRLPGE